MGESWNTPDDLKEEVTGSPQLGEGCHTPDELEVAKTSKEVLYVLYKYAVYGKKAGEPITTRQKWGLMISAEEAARVKNMEVEGNRSYLTNPKWHGESNLIKAIKHWFDYNGIEWQEEKESDDVHINVKAVEACVRRLGLEEMEQTKERLKSVWATITEYRNLLFNDDFPEVNERTHSVCICVVKGSDE